MYFKISKESPIFETLKEIWSRGSECEAEAADWILNRFKKRYDFANPEGVLFGGIGAVRFPKGSKRHWRQINAIHKLYVPKLGVDIKSIAALPVVQKSELKELLNYGNYPTPDGRINTIPTVDIGEDYALINVPDYVRGYEPPNDLTEILGSEFNYLTDQSESWRKRNE